jgi:hypothetical protein
MPELTASCEFVRGNSSFGWGISAILIVAMAWMGNDEERSCNDPQIDSRRSLCMNMSFYTMGGEVKSACSRPCTGDWSAHTSLDHEWGLTVEARGFVTSVNLNPAYKIRCGCPATPSCPSSVEYCTIPYLKIFHRAQSSNDFWAMLSAESSTHQLSRRDSIRSRRLALGPCSVGNDKLLSIKSTDNRYRYRIVIDRF